METFRNAFPVPLTDIEAALFDPCYVAHPACGNLPLVLLFERFDFLREAILQIWKRPNEKEAIAILNQMMFYYADLSGDRRACDRLYKKNSPTKNKKGRVAREEAYGAEPKQEENLHMKIFKEAACRLASEPGKDLDFGNDDWDARIVEEDETSIKFIVACINRDYQKEKEVTRVEFEAIVREVEEEIVAEEKTRKRAAGNPKKPRSD